MPYVNIKITREGASAEQKAALIAGVTALLDVAPRTALRDRNGVLQTVSVDVLAVGDTVVVRPGDRAPSDGEILSGASDMNEAPVTGESTPVARKTGDIERMQALLADPRLRARPLFQNADKQITRINQQIRAVTANRELGAREKNDRLEALNARRNQIAMQVDLAARELE